MRATANSTGERKLRDRVEDRRPEAVDARAARRRRRRPISLGDFGSCFAIVCRRGSTSRSARTCSKPLEPAARRGQLIARSRRRSGEVRASTAEAPKPVSSATETKSNADGEPEFRSHDVYRLGSQ